MKTMLDIQQVLRKHGTIIYTRDRLVDLSLMEEEWRELYKWKMIEQHQFQQGILLLREEYRKEEEKRMKSNFK